MRLGRLPRKTLLQTATGRLEYVLSGRGAHALVLFNGSGITLEGWARLYPDIERIGRVLAWNRRGVGASSRPAAPPTGTVVLGELHQLLAALELAPPYLLVGHSVGALYAQLFARRHPQEVAAVVLLEPTHPREHDRLQGQEGRLASVLGRMLSAPQRLFRANLHAELAGIEAIAREVEAAGPFPPVPLTVVVGGHQPPRWLVSDEQRRVQRARQQALVRLSPQGRLVVARRSGHFPQVTQPELVLDVLRSAEAAARLLGRQALVQHVDGEQVQDAREDLLEPAHR